MAEVKVSAENLSQGKLADEIDARLDEITQEMVRRKQQHQKPGAHTATIKVTFKPTKVEDVWETVVESSAKHPSDKTSSITILSGQELKTDDVSHDGTQPGFDFDGSKGGEAADNEDSNGGATIHSLKDGTNDA